MHRCKQVVPSWPKGFSSSFATCQRVGDQSALKCPKKVAVISTLVAPRSNTKGFRRGRSTKPEASWSCKGFLSDLSSARVKPCLFLLWIKIIWRNYCWKPALDHDRKVVRRADAKTRSSTSSTTTTTSAQVHTCHLIRCAVCMYLWMDFSTCIVEICPCKECLAPCICPVDLARFEMKSLVTKVLLVIDIDDFPLWCRSSC